MALQSARPSQQRSSSMSPGSSSTGGTQESALGAVGAGAQRAAGPIRCSSSHWSWSAEWPRPASSSVDTPNRRRATYLHDARLASVSSESRQNARARRRASGKLTKRRAAATCPFRLVDWPAEALQPMLATRPDLPPPLLRATSTGERRMRVQERTEPRSDQLRADSNALSDTILQSCGLT